MRVISAAALAALLSLPLLACRRDKGGGDGTGVGAATPAPPAEREEVYLQLDVAVVAGAQPAALLDGWLVPGETPAGSRRWHPVAERLPVLAKLPRAVGADVYGDPGYVVVAFRGAAAAATGLMDSELAAMASAVGARPEARGAVLHLLDDRDGTVVSVLAIAGHDPAEAAMALLDVWAPDLELGYAPEGLAGEGEVDRARLTAALRALPDVEGDLKRVTGARFAREGGGVRVTFAPETDTRALATSLVARLGAIAAPVVVRDGGGGAARP